MFAEEVVDIGMVDREVLVPGADDPRELLGDHLVRASFHAERVRSEVGRQSVHGAEDGAAVQTAGQREPDRRGRGERAFDCAGKRGLDRGDVVGFVRPPFVEQGLQIDVRLERDAAGADVVRQHRAGIEQLDVLREGLVAQHDPARQIVGDRAQIEPRHPGRAAEQRREIGAEHEAVGLLPPVQRVVADRIGCEDQPLGRLVEQREAEFAFEVAHEVDAPLRVHLPEERAEGARGDWGAKVRPQRRLVVEHAVEDDGRRSGGACALLAERRQVDLRQPPAGAVDLLDRQPTMPLHACEGRVESCRAIVRVARRCAAEQSGHYRPPNVQRGSICAGSTLKRS